MFGTDVILIGIRGNDIRFSNSSYGAMAATIDNIKLDYVGVCREFPDLEIAPDWREQAIARFKSKISLLKTEKDIAEYLINDLRKFGYVPKWKQVHGFRRIAIT